MNRILCWALYQVRRLELWLEEQTGLDAYEVYANALDELGDDEQSHVTMMAAAYYERTRIDPVEAQLLVTRWTDPFTGKRMKTYEFAQVLD